MLKFVVWPLAGLVFCASAPPGVAQSALAPEVLLLSRINRHMQQELARLPAITCLETIQRYRRSAASKPLLHTDTLRVEVAEIGDRELFSWPGADKFEERDLIDLVGAGTVSSGDFSLHARAIFVRMNAQVAFSGNEEVGGHPTVRFNYEIPILTSGFVVAYGGARARVASRGSFWVDPETLDLQRLLVIADEIPPHVALARVETVLDYARTQIGDTSALLPQRAESTLTNIAGAVSRNVTEFSHCRQYIGESKIVSPDYAPRSDARGAKPLGMQLPAKLEIDIELIEDVESRTARVGDLVSGHLRADVKRNREIVIPKHAAVHGRIRRLEYYAAPQPHFILGLEFSEIEFDGKHARFFGQMKSITPLEGVSTGFSVSRSYSKPHAVGMEERTDTETITTEQIPGVGALFITGKTFRLPRGFTMSWITEDVRAKK